MERAEKQLKTSKISGEIKDKANQVIIAANKLQQYLDSYDQKYDELNSTLRLCEENKIKFDESMKSLAELQDLISVQEYDEAIDMANIGEQEIKEKTQQTTQALEHLVSKRSEYNTTLNRTTITYCQTRIELHQWAIPIDPDEEYLEADRLIANTPLEIFYSLKEDFIKTISTFPQFSIRRKYNQMKIWIGTLRKIQTTLRRENISLDSSTRHEMDDFFFVLRRNHAEYDISDIPAFAQGYESNWDQFINQAKDVLSKETS